MSTLCNYSFQLPPDGLRCSTDSGYTQTEAIELVVSEGTTPVYVQSITVQFPVGLDQATYLSDTSNISVNAVFPSDVQMTQLNPGQFRFTPTAGGYFTFGGAGGYILFSGIVMNTEVGVVNVTITESSTTSSSSAASGQFTTSSCGNAIGKFPYRFYMRNFGADKATVANGETVTLKWSAAQNGSYRLLWSDARGQQSLDVSDLRTWVSPPLYQDTAFVLQGRTVNGGTRYMELTTSVMVSNPDLVAKTVVIGDVSVGASGGGSGSGSSGSGSGSGSSGSGSGGNTPPPTTTVFAIDNDSAYTNVFRPGSNNQVPQTFRSGASGKLDSMQFYLTGAGSPVRLQLMQDNNLVGDAQMSVASGTTGWVTVNFSGGGQVVEGTEYRIMFSFNDTSGWEFQVNNSTNGGSQSLFGTSECLLMRVVLTVTGGNTDVAPTVMLDNTRVDGAEGLYLDNSRPFAQYQQVIPAKSFRATSLALYCSQYLEPASSVPTILVQIGRGTSSADFVPELDLPNFQMLEQQFTEQSFEYDFEAGGNYMLALWPSPSAEVTLGINDNLEFGELGNIGKAVQFQIWGTPAMDSTSTRKQLAEKANLPILDVLGKARLQSLQVSGQDFSVGEQITVTRSQVVSNKNNHSGGAYVDAGQTQYQSFVPASSFKGLRVQFSCQTSGPDGTPITISLGKGTSSYDFVPEFESEAVTFMSDTWCGTTFDYDFEAGQSYLFALANSSNENTCINYNQGQMSNGQLLGFSPGMNFLFTVDGLITQGTATLKVATSGNVGIGKLDPQYALDVAGTIQATSVIQSSDQRLKENIATLPGALDQIALLRGVSYNRKGSGRAELGLIAQEVAAVFPDLVHYDDSGLAGLAYTQLTAVFVEAIKALKADNDQLRADVEALKRRDLH